MSREQLATRIFKALNSQRNKHFEIDRDTLREILEHLDMPVVKQDVEDYWCVNCGGEKRNLELGIV